MLGTAARHDQLSGQKTAFDKSVKVKTPIRRFILTVNYTIAAVICLILVAQTHIPTVERAIYGLGTIFLGMGVRRAVKTLMPLDEDNMGET